jgi:hypothetical protein
LPNRRPIMAVMIWNRRLGGCIGALITTVPQNGDAVGDGEHFFQSMHET